MFRIENLKPSAHGTFRTLAAPIMAKNVFYLYQKTFDGLRN
jgi:hypothetical protein